MKKLNSFYFERFVPFAVRYAQAPRALPFAGGRVLRRWEWYPRLAGHLLRAAPALLRDRWAVRGAASTPPLSALDEVRFVGQRKGWTDRYF